MAYYVSKGAKLKCPMGSEQSSLEVVHLERPVLLRGEPMANIMDFKPMVNIKPFGRCCSLMNPVVAAATAANYGRLQEMPCIPNPTAPWQGGKMKLDIKGAPALLSTSKCMCMWAGAIEITHPGQDAVYEGGPMTITITDPTIETLQSLESMGGDAGEALTGGLQPSQPGALGSGFQPADLQSSLQTAIGGIQLPQIPSFVTEMKEAAETLLQKAINAIESGKEKSEEIKSSKFIVDVKGEKEVFSGQEITYKAIVCDIGGPVENCDVNWVIKVGGKELKKEDIEKDNDIRIEKDKITIETEDAWVGEEIIATPYLDSNSPDEDKSVKTKIIQRTLITGVTSDKKEGEEALPGQKIKYYVTSYNKSKVRDGERKGVEWALKIGDEEPKTLEEKGEVLELEIKGLIAIFGI